MIDKQETFANYMFQEIYGTLRDENNQLYSEVYQFEVEELIKDMLFDLTTILRTFRKISIGDISKVFAIHFWDTEAIANYNIADVAFKFSELYGDLITFG